MENIIPMHINNKFERIYLSYYDENRKKQYLDFNNFRNYYYYSNYNKPILNKKNAIKQFDKFNLPEAKIKDNTYEGDLKISKRFMLDTFGHKTELEKVDTRICYLDIECLINGKINTRGDDPITALSIYDNRTNAIYTFAYHKNPRLDKDNKIRIDNNEYDMLVNFLKFMKVCKFDIITGWNVYNFDIPYLCNRLNKYDLMNDLSPFNIVDKWFSIKSQKEVFNIFGISVVDYLDLYKKYSFNSLSSYSLQNVSDFELGEGKIDFDGDLNDLYINDINKYLEYNRHDVRLVKKLEGKLKFIEILDETKRLGMCNFDEALHVSNVIDNMLIRFLNKAGFVVKTAQYITNNTSYAGAYVKTPTPQIADYIICCDFKSLYPFIIMNYNISPETFIKKIPEDMVNTYKCAEDEVVAFNGAVFKKNVKGIFFKILDWLYKKRAEYKKLSIEAKDTNLSNIYDIKQSAVKTILNSVYGFVGYVGSRFFNVHLAEAITLTGQYLIKYAINEIDKMGYNTITSDTDSVLFSVPGVKSKEEAIKIGLEVSKDINAKLKILCKEKNNIDNSNFDFEYEKLAKRGIFFAKKHYILKLIHKDGKDIDKTDFKGVSVKKNDTSKYSKKYLKQIFDIILNTDDYLDAVSGVIDTFNNNLTVASFEDIGVPISATRKLSSYTKTLPMHIRGCLLWEKHYAKKYNKSFDNIYKGKLYFIKNYISPEKDIEEFGNKEPVICVPEDCKFPAGLMIDYKRTRTRLIDKQLSGLLDILDFIKAKNSLPKYLEYDNKKILEIFLEELKNDIIIETKDYLHKIDKISFKKKFIKFIDTTIQQKIYSLLYSNDSI